MSTMTAPARLMRCPACNNPIYATVTYKLDFGGKQSEGTVGPSIETAAKVTAKVSGIKVFHDCRDGELTRLDAEVAK